MAAQGLFLSLPHPDSRSRKTPLRRGFSLRRAAMGAGPLSATKRIGADFVPAFSDFARLASCFPTLENIGLHAVRSVAQPGSALDWGLLSPLPNSHSIISGYFTFSHASWEFPWEFALRDEHRPDAPLDDPAGDRTGLHGGLLGVVEHPAVYGLLTSCERNKNMLPSPSVGPSNPGGHFEQTQKTERAFGAGSQSNFG